MSARLDLGSDGNFPGRFRIPTRWSLARALGQQDPGHYWKR